MYLTLCLAAQVFQGLHIGRFLNSLQKKLFQYTAKRLIIYRLTDITRGTLYPAAGMKYPFEMRFFLSRFPPPVKKNLVRKI